MTNFQVDNTTRFNPVTPPGNKIPNQTVYGGIDKSFNGFSKMIGEASQLAGPWLQAYNPTGSQVVNAAVSTFGGGGGGYGYGGGAWDKAINAPPGYPPTGGPGAGPGGGATTPSSLMNGGDTFDVNEMFLGQLYLVKKQTELQMSTQTIMMLSNAEKARYDAATNTIRNYRP